MYLENIFIFQNDLFSGATFNSLLSLPFFLPDACNPGSVFESITLTIYTVSSSKI
jgi:hypothetical protein